MKRQRTENREQGSGGGPTDPNQPLGAGPWVPQVSYLRPGKATLWPRLIGSAVILLAAAVAVAPQLVLGNSCGHDFDFHLVSWLDCLNGWRHGIPYPHWTASANFGAGEPRFLFYPPLTWMLGAALGFVLPWHFVPVAVTFLFLAGTGLATRALARQALPEGAATLAGCVALTSVYALFTAYERSAFGELAGGFWIPLLLLLILRDRHPAGSRWKRALDGSALPLALVLAGCWLSNTPLGVMACYLLAAAALAAAWLARSWAPVLRASLAAILGTMLAGLYLFPAFCEQRWVDVRQVTNRPGLLIEDSWLFAHHASPLLAEHDVELRKVSMIAAAMLVLAACGLLASWLRTRLAPRNPSVSRRWWLPLSLIPPAVLFLQLPISLAVWNLLPKLRFLQFPWRWLVVLEAPMAIFFAAAVWPVRRGRQVVVAAVCAALFFAATLFAARSFFQACYPEDTVAGVLATLRAGEGVEGYDEYEPPGVSNLLLATGLPDACLVADSSAGLGIIDTPGANPDWWIEQGSCGAIAAWRFNQPEHKRLTAVTSRSGYLILRLRGYPAWSVMVNGRRVETLPWRSDGLMAVPVPQGPVDLAVDWTTTPDVIAGRWLSALAVLLLTGLWLLERKPRLPHLS